MKGNREEEGASGESGVGLSGGGVGWQGGGGTRPRRDACTRAAERGGDGVGADRAQTISAARSRKSG